jgi:hypothetical protein
MNSEDLAELQRIFPHTTPGRWKLWGNSIMADTRGDSDVKYAAEVASFNSPRTWDADMCAILQRNMPELLADAQALADMRTLDEWAAGQPIRTPSPSPHRTEVGDWFIWLSTGKYFDGPTPEAARAKAAAWVREQGK